MGDLVVYEHIDQFSRAIKAMKTNDLIRKMGEKELQLKLMQAEIFRRQL